MDVYDAFEELEGKIRKLEQHRRFKEDWHANINTGPSNVRRLKPICRKCKYDNLCNSYPVKKHYAPINCPMLLELTVVRKW